MSFGHGGPFDGPGGSGTPDWDALAQESEAAARRKRWMLIGGSALAAVAVAGIVTAAVVTSNDSGGGNPTASPTGSGATQAPEPRPSFSDVSVPPPPNPQDYISDPEKDRAPLTPATLFPDKTMANGARTYSRTNTATTKDCTAAAQGALGSLLSHNGCSQLLRATYSKGGVSVTVGVAVFDSPAQAAKVRDQYKGNLAPLSGGGVPASFCVGTGCVTTANAVGRYAYFTIAGNDDGKRVESTKSKAGQIGRDGGFYAFHRIQQRGKDQAAKAAAAQSQ
ncbi:hypothetical protein [Streptomyces halobius]|uniref:Uncharacterized protein n=1 Tax=Streptomyces halobius TaxID=2879846 RepID=A0ABY4ME98_9ACTN|nr:hypothetical protein [Streptomyces halobius]UQA94720.1 hypothetical protein K9S39_25240 [Streptomyces halobius]